MPKENGKGPRETGAGCGRGAGAGRGKGMGNARRGGTAGGSQIVKNCVCPSCGKKVPHQRGNPCNEIKCPECEVTLIPEQ